jgi:glutathione S-transferase
VPTLLIDGCPLTEVAAILFYLARRYSEASLLPQDDVEQEAQALSWMSFIAATIHSAWAARHQRADHVRNVFALAERRLGTGEWALGSRYSIADIHPFRLFWRFRNAVQPAPDEFPNLSAHHDRMMDRSAVQRACKVDEAIGYELPA